jgi:hypothetical protein
MISTLRRTAPWFLAALWDTCVIGRYHSLTQRAEIPQ